MGTRNRLIDLNNHLFEQLERLNDEDLVGEKLDTELKRASAITSVSAQIIKNANTMLAGQKYIDNALGDVRGEATRILVGKGND